MISTVSLPIETPRPQARSPRAWWLRLSRRRRYALLATSVLLFLVISGVLARFLTVENAERNDLLALVQAEARGSLPGMLDELSGCRENQSCLTTAKANASNPRLRRAGAVKILQIQSKTAYSLFGATGRTRLAWTVIGTLPVVQCVDVRRTGNFLSGIHVQLFGLSAPIDNEGRCTKASAIEKAEEEVSLGGAER
jgi:hypothetical protein